MAKQPGQPGTKPPTTPVPSGGTGEQLNELLATTAPGSTLTITGEWVCNHSVKVPANVILSARDALLIQPTDGRDLTYPDAKNWDTGLRGRCAVIAAAGAVVSANVRGPGATYDPATEAQHAFAARGDGVRFEDCTATDVLGDGVSFGEQSGCVASHITVDGAGRQGFSWVEGTDGLLTDASFARVARTVIDLEPMATLGQVIRGFTARRITATTFANFLLGSGSSGEVHDVVCEDFTAPKLGVKFQRSGGGPKSNLTFRRFVGTEPKDAIAFTFHNIDGPVLIEGCTQPFVVGKEWLAAVRAVNVPGLVLTGNSWPGADAELTTT